MTTADAVVPEGFVALPFEGGNAFVKLTMQLYARMEDTGPVYAFRVGEQHCNATGRCHGGMLLTFADTYLPSLARFDPEIDDGYTPTVSLTADFVGPATLGAWVEGRGRILRRSGRLLFIEGLITIEGQPVLRANGIFKRGKPGERNQKNQELQNLIGSRKD